MLSASKLVSCLFCSAFTSISTIAGICIYTNNSYVDLGYYGKEDVFQNNSDSYYNPHLLSASSINSLSRTYLMKNVFSLMWKNSSTTDLFNSFLINWVVDESHIGTHYVPQWNNPVNKINLLMGTRLTDVKKLFSKVKDFSSEVNETSGKVKLKNKCDSCDSHKFHISSNFLSKDFSKETAEPIYEITEPGENYVAKFQEHSQYIEIDKDDVELIYAATDLKINRNIFNLKTDELNNASLNSWLTYIHNYEHKDIDWVEEVGDNKMFVDFAVIKIAIPVYKLTENMIVHLNDIFQNYHPLLPINDAQFDLDKNKVGTMVLGGWKPLSEYQQKLLEFSKIVSELVLKTDKKGSVTSTNASTITKSSYSEWFELKFFPNIHDAHDKYKDKYEMTNIALYPNDHLGVLIFKYQIKTKDSNIVFPKVFSSIFGQWKKVIKNHDLPQNEGFSIETKNADPTAYSKSSFLSIKPVGKAEWNEYLIDNGYFDFSSMSSAFSRSLSVDTNSSEKDDIIANFSLNNEKFVNVGHHVTVPNLNVQDLKNSLVTTYNWNDDEEDTLFGMFEGNSTFENRWFGKKKSAKILMFNSPTRYDLFSSCNNISKPSLGDVLHKKNLVSKIVKPELMNLNNEKCEEQQQ